MPRPTPARILYLAIGLIVGLALTIGIQFWVLPGVIANLPFIPREPVAVVPSGPSQFIASTLERVLVVNLTQQVGNVVMRVNALEVFQDGITLTYTVTNGRGTATALTIEPDTFSMTDERGTAYTISNLGTGAVPSAGLTVGMVSFTPAPPLETRGLRLVIPNVLSLNLRPREGQSRVVGGPWEFQIPFRS